VFTSYSSWNTSNSSEHVIVLKAQSLGTKGSVALRVFLVLLVVGSAEIVAGMSYSRSIALIADGIESLAASLVFLIVWIGLRISIRAPDGKFHFGYYRFETLGSLLAAFFMAIFGGFLVYESYRLWLTPRRVTNIETALIITGGALAASLLISFWTQRASKESGAVSFRTGVLNAIIDVFSSVVAIASIVLNGYFGVLHADAVGGILIASSVFAVAYSISREASLVLLDACQCGDVVSDITGIAKKVKGVREVHGVRMRKMGPFIVGDMHIVLDGDTKVVEADRISSQIEELVQEEFDTVIEIKIRIESAETHDAHSAPRTQSEPEPKQSRHTTPARK
jgi:cation diffusion facilitator family transporter